MPIEWSAIARQHAGVHLAGVLEVARRELQTVVCTWPSATCHRLDTQVDHERRQRKKPRKAVEIVAFRRA